MMGGVRPRRGEVWLHRLFRLPAVVLAIAPGTYDRFLV
jgi:hypothetical protein